MSCLSMFRLAISHGERAVHLHLFILFSLCICTYLNTYKREAEHHTCCRRIQLEVNQLSGSIPCHFPSVYVNGAVLVIQVVPRTYVSACKNMETCVRAYPSAGRIPETRHVIKALPCMHACMKSKKEFPWNLQGGYLQEFQDSLLGPWCRPFHLSSHWRPHSRYPVSDHAEM